MRQVEMTLEYQPYILAAPIAAKDQYAQACSNDNPTIASWRETWLKQFQANKETFGSLAQHSAGKLFGKHQGMPVIVAGSGPSLTYNGKLLKILFPEIRHVRHDDIEQFGDHRCHPLEMSGTGCTAER